MSTVKRRANIGAWVVFAAMSAGIAHADTVTINFGTVARYTGTDPIAGSAPWVSLSILDVALGSVQVTVNTLLPSVGSPPQTVDRPVAQRACGGHGWPHQPGVYARHGHRTEPGEFRQRWIDVLDHANDDTLGRHRRTGRPLQHLPALPEQRQRHHFQGHQTQAFMLSGTGLSAASFFALAAQTTGGQPSPSFYGLAALTNAAGTPGSGIAYIGALDANLSAVPLPAAAWLLLSGLLGVGAARRRAA